MALRQSVGVSLRHTVLDLLYPRSCGGCGADMDDQDGMLCWNCRATLHTIGDPCCAWCGNPLEGRADHAYTCFHCTEMQPAFDRARSAVRFEGVAAQLIHQFKYHAALWLRDEFVDWLAACCQVHYPDLRFDAVCPVPLYPARQRERGYNQAALLADGLARRLRSPLWRNALRRPRPTETQTHLTARQRLSNVADAFRGGSGRITGKALLLVDDVMTTGATTSACARALKEAGCRSVHVVTLARGQ